MQRSTSLQGECYYHHRCHYTAAAVTAPPQLLWMLLTMSPHSCAARTKSAAHLHCSMSFQVSFRRLSDQDRDVYSRVLSYCPSETNG